MNRPLIAIAALLVTGAAAAASRTALDFVAAPPGLADGLRGAALRGTLVFSDQSQSVAMLEFGKGDVRMVRVGAQLPGIGTLVGVEAKAVYIDVNGTVVRFNFNDSAAPGSNALVAATTRPLAARADAVSSPVAQASLSAAATASAGTAGQPFVVPDRRAMGFVVDSDAEDPSLDATPKAGETIDTTDWNAISRARR